MAIKCEHIPYQSTGYFSTIVTDYLEGDKKLRPFYQHQPNIAGLKDAMFARKNFPFRKELVASLEKWYEDLEMGEAVKQNIQLLLEENTFTVTTAHQPNIFSGPLYVVYKILHTIKLATALKNAFPENNFVPVFYMGSEDADLEELNHVSVDGKIYTWHTPQSGAVGRMLVDGALLALIHEMQGQLGVQPFGNDWINLLKACYTEGTPIQKATQKLLHSLFAERGLVILIPDDAGLKKIFEPVVEKELLSQFSHQSLMPVKDALGKHYPLQTAGRPLNLFYLIDDKRERIEKENNHFFVHNLSLEFSETEIIQEMKNFPERFSGNVILRGVFQETILPNIAFIGGGGELAYWLELKNVFEDACVPYPVLFLRNSFLLIHEKEQKSIAQLALQASDLFKPTDILTKEFVLRSVGVNAFLQEEMDAMDDIYLSALQKAKSTDITLEKHVLALKARAEKRLQALEKKLVRAEKRKQETGVSKTHRLKENLFPGGSLQERTENIAAFYAIYGSSLLENILKCSNDIDHGFTIMYM